MIYDYMCPKCENVIEAVHKSDEILEISCIKCQCPLEKIFSAVAFVLQGVGFYGKGRTKRAK